MTHVQDARRDLKKLYRCNTRSFMRSKLTAGLFFVSSKCLHLLTDVSDVENLNQMIPRCGQEPVSILIPLDIHNSILMGMTFL